MIGLVTQAFRIFTQNEGYRTLLHTHSLNETQMIESLHNAFEENRGRI